MTGCTSDTRGLSNSVSSFLESVANSTEETFESISGEDMMSKTKVFNKEVKNIRQKWEKRREAKLAKNCCKCCLKLVVEECQNKNKHSRKRHPTEETDCCREITYKVSQEEEHEQPNGAEIKIINLEENPVILEILAGLD